MIEGQLEHPHLRPLQFRQPGWFAAGAGAASSAMTGSGAAAIAAMAAGIPFSPILIASGAAFLLATQALGVALTPSKERSTATLIGLVLSVGHAVLMAGFVVACSMPIAARAVLEPLFGAAPFSMLGNSGPIATFGPLYLAIFLVFSVIAPISLIIFRYITFRR